MSMEDQEEVEVDEKSLDKELAGHGIFEDGMSLEDKRELLAVFKASESTALEEENDRVGVGLSSSRHCSIACDVKIENPVQKPETTSGGNNVTLFSASEPSSNVNKVLDDSDELESQSKISKFSPKIPRLSLRADVKLSINNRSEANGESDVITPDTNLSQSLNNPDDSGKYAKNTDISLRLKNSRLKVFSKEDRKRNIDVFNCEKYPVEHPLVCKQHNVSGKQAFYYVPHGMNLKDFTAYFKQELSTMAQQLVATQQKSLNFVHWGDPIVGIAETDDTEDEVNGQDPDEKLSGSPAPQSPRYNFRGRTNKRKCKDDIFTYSSEDGSSNEDQLFTKKENKRRPQSTVNPYAGVSKRKSIFTAFGDHLAESVSPVNASQISINAKSTAENDDVSIDNESLTNDQDDEENSQNIEKFANKTGPGSNNEKLFSEMVCDSDEDSNNYDNKFMRSLSKISNSCKGKKGKKILTRKVSPLEESEESSTGGVWLNTSSYKEAEEEKIIIKPGPVNMKKKSTRNKRSLLKQQGFFQKTNKTQQGSSQEVDDQLVTDEIEDRVQEIHLIACPICKEQFSSTDIEFHAAECSLDPAPSKTDICPICQERFDSGPTFDNHAKHCKVNRRLVPPPQHLNRNRNRR